MIHYNDYVNIAALVALVTGMFGVKRGKSARDGAIVSTAIFLLRYVIYYDQFDRVHILLGEHQGKLHVLITEVLIGALLGLICGWFGGKLWKFMNPKSTKKT